MRSSPLPPLRVSEMPLSKVDLREGRAPMVACPLCDRWRAVRQRKLTPHHLPGTSKPCPQSRRGVWVDITPALFALKYREAVHDAGRRQEVVRARPRPRRYPKGKPASDLRQA
jgi:hypothetical protein